MSDQADHDEVPTAAEITGIALAVRDEAVADLLANLTKGYVDAMTTLQGRNLSSLHGGDMQKILMMLRLHMPETEQLGEIDRGIGRAVASIAEARVQTKPPNKYVPRQHRDRIDQAGD